MNALRHTVIPSYHAEAELAAFPLASEAALCIGTTYLASTLDEPTKQLWRAAESNLVEASPALSLDEIGAMRDLVWFRYAYGSQRALSLTDFLRETARTYLRVEGGVAVPRLDYRLHGEHSSDLDATSGRDIWRWMSFALPPDLLLAALSAPIPPASVAAVSPVLSALLQQHGFAETHVHLGAAMTFAVLWSSAVHAIADSRMKATALQSPGAALNGGRDLAPWLLRAAIARHILGSFLSLAGTDTFDEFVARVRKRISERRGRTTTAVLERALADLCVGRLAKSGPSFAELQTLYADISGVRTRRPTEGEQPAHGLDPLYSFTQGDPAWSSPEVWLVSRGLTYMQKVRDGARGDVRMASLFERLFWQTVRVRCLLYRHVVQRPMTPGLQWFIRFFARIKPLRSSLSPSRRLPNMRLTAAADVCGLNAGLSAIELRISPDKTTQKTLMDLRDGDAFIQGAIVARERATDAREHSRMNRLLDAPAQARAIGIGNRDQLTSVRPRDILEVGYILHFARNRGGAFKKGALRAGWQGTAADPSHAYNTTGYRFGRHYLELCHQALTVGRLLSAFPVTLELVRGVDVCTDEVGIPTWVVAPLVRYVRDASAAASAALLRSRNHVVPSIRTAVHAGEDFVHLLSGMRRLGESIEYFRLGPGDRIGHGLSLGINPEPWARSMGRIAMSREDRLLDLLWAWTWISRGIISSEEAPFIESEIRRLSDSMFPADEQPPRTRQRPYEATNLVQLVADLHDEECLRTVGFPSRVAAGVSEISDDRRNLLRRYLTSRVVFARSKEAIWVDPSREGKLLSQLQEMLRKRLGASDIAVEVNPSSNLLIGHVPDLREHPLWRLRPGPHRPAVASPVTLCIGSDDPLTFGTTLPEEYQLLHDALVADGASADQAERWLDETRRAGLTRKFTVPRSGLRLTEPIPVTTRLTLPP